MTEDHGHSGMQLDAYLDGVMTPDECAEFQRQIDSDDDLRKQIEIQKEIDQAFGRLFKPPSAERVPDVITDLRESEPYTLPPTTKRDWGAVPRRLAVAAALVAGVFGGWLTWNALQPSSLSKPYGPWRSIEMVYNDSVANGMKPEWTCDNELEFAVSIRNHFGQAAVIPFELPDGTAALGLAYCNSISRRTVYLLAEVNGEPVIVFIDRVEADQGPTVDESSGLNLFKRRIGRLVLYELSPLEKPALLELFYDPDADSTSPVDLP